MQVAMTANKKSCCEFLILLQQGITEDDPEKMDEAQKEEYNSLIRTVTKTNTEAIKSAKENLQFENVDQLEQGASTLYSITVRKTK